MNKKGSKYYQYFNSNHVKIRCAYGQGLVETMKNGRHILKITVVILIVAKTQSPLKGASSYYQLLPLESNLLVPSFSENGWQKSAQGKAQESPKNVDTTWEIEMGDTSVGNRILKGRIKWGWKELDPFAEAPGSRGILPSLCPFWTQGGGDPHYR